MMPQDQEFIAQRRLGREQAGLELPGRGVAMRQTTRDYGTIEWQLLIDPGTGRLTASQGIIVAPGRKNAGLRPGTRQFFRRRGRRRGGGGKERRRETSSGAA